MYNHNLAIVLLLSCYCLAIELVICNCLAIVLPLSCNCLAIVLQLSCNCLAIVLLLSCYVAMLLLNCAVLLFCCYEIAIVFRLDMLVYLFIYAFTHVFV